MGKLIADHSPVIMAAKTQVAPTNEQLRIAQLCVEKEDQTVLKRKCQQVMETTNCTEHEAMMVLHDCNYDLNEAVTKYFDGKSGQSEWQTTGKRVKKSQKDHENHAQHDDDFVPNVNDDPSVAHDHNDVDGPGARSGLGGHVAKSNGLRRFPNKTLDGHAPPRGRGRGFSSSRGGRSRGRGFVSNSNGEHSTDRSSYRTGRPVGRGFTNSNTGGENYRGGSVGFNRRQRENAEPAFDSGIPTWKTDNLESNIWNNDMAGRPPTGGGTVDDVVDQWKGPDNRPTDASANDQTTDGCMWNSSMAQQHQNLRARRISGGPRSQRHGQGRNERQTYAPPPVSNHAHEWNPTTDDWDEEEDWQKMANRVFTNVKVNQSSQNVTSVPSMQPLVGSSPLTSTVTSTVSSVAPPPLSTAAPSIANVIATGSGCSPLPPGVSPSSMLTTAIQNIDSTGLSTHVRGESINVNLLFGQKSTPNDVMNNVMGDSASGQWSKQATDTLKNELGIGKVALPGLDQTSQLISRTHNAYPSHKPVASKVEMPSTVPNVGQIDVEFGEFSSVNKTRSSGEEQKNYFDFTATPYVTNELGLTPSTQQQPLPMAGTVYQTRTPSKDLHQYQSPQAQQPQQMQHQQIPQQTAHYAPATSANVADLTSAKQQTSTSLSIGGNVAGASATSTATATNNSNAGVNNINRSPVTQSTASQSKAQQPGPNSAMPAQQSQQQRQYLASNSRIDSTGTASQISKDPSTIPTMVSLQTTQSSAGLSYNSSTASRTTLTTNANTKPAINTPTLFNPPTNPSYQQAYAAAMPYLYQTPDQSFLNTLQFLSPAAATYPFGSLGALPFDISSLSVRDNQQAVNAGSADAKTFVGGRPVIDMPLTSSSAAPTSGVGGSLNAPPGLGGNSATPVSSVSTLNNLSVGVASDQHQQAAAAAAAAQLLAAPAATAFHAYPTLMQAGPYFTPFVVPTVTNSSASTVNTANQYNKNTGVFPSPQAMYYNGDVQLPQEYSKNVYGLTVAQASTNLGKHQASASSAGMAANDKGYSAPGLKVFDGKTFQQNTATPPPGMGGVGFPPGAATATFHSSGQAAAYSAYPPQFLTHPINMIPPNMAAQAQPVNQSEMFANAGQRVGNAGAKSGANVYQTKGWNS